MIASVAEKMRPSEEALSAVYRALCEELAITEKIPVNFLRTEETGPLVSQSCPGFLSTSTIHFFDTYLPEHLYRPEGYTEDQLDKTNYYEWRLAM